MSTPLPVQSKQDSKFFRQTAEDTTLRNKMEGGYVSARPRHTRAPRRIFTTGFTDLSDADKILLESFWDTQGGHGLVAYTHPISGVVYTTRMMGPPIFQYTGVGPLRRWNCEALTLEEV